MSDDAERISVEVAVVGFLHSAGDRDQYWEFFGFVTYTGIGSIGGRSTAEFVLDWLEGNDGLGIDDVADILVDRGTRWLRRHRDKDGNRYRHTFVVAASRRRLLKRSWCPTSRTASASRGLRKII